MAVPAAMTFVYMHMLQEGSMTSRWAEISCSHLAFPHAGRDIHNLLRGLLQLCTVFQELSIVAVVMAILQIATAAAVWPLVTLPVAVVSVVITAVRVITWHHPQVWLQTTECPKASVLTHFLPNGIVVCLD